MRSSVNLYHTNWPDKNPPCGPIICNRGGNVRDVCFFRRYWHGPLCCTCSQQQVTILGSSEGCGFYVLSLIAPINVNMKVRLKLWKAPHNWMRNVGVDHQGWKEYKKKSCQGEGVNWLHLKKTRYWSGSFW